jgi:catechol 2,3-dioxygenase-like lactoylglutathione lyase family enzyme
VKCLRAATLSVADIGRSRSLYRDWLDYEIVESGALEAALAESWGAPASAGRRYAVLQPRSGASIFLRLVEDEPHPDFEPLTTYGWAAIEICVEDVLEVNDRMLASPFEIIGPPRELDGLPAIFPMQVKGPDGEIVYLTQIRDDLPSYDLPRATTLVDRMFIHVLACSDMRASLRFAEEQLGFGFGREMDIVYTMLANAFGMPHARTFTICTGIHGRDVFLEFDQMPPQATPRPCHKGRLPPGVALSTLILPDFVTRIRKLGSWLIGEPAPHQGPIYAGKLSATLRGPDGTLFEVVEP